jgi:hypothetical protein
MKRPSPACQSKYQTTWSIFVQRIIFYDFSAINCLPYFRNPDFPQDRLVGRVFGKLKFVLPEFYPDFLNHAKAVVWIGTFHKRVQYKNIQHRPGKFKRGGAKTKNGPRQSPRPVGEYGECGVGKMPPRGWRMSTARSGILPTMPAQARHCGA